jgi:orotidine-5'-phosphate decarboxylase
MVTARYNAPMNFVNALNAAWASSNSALCVGLDPDPSKLPKHLLANGDIAQAILHFCKTIVDATAPFVCSFKPQIAYFASQRAERELEALIAHIHENHPGIPVILDAKRGDIGSTAEHYAKEAFERYQADAVTVSPYMGFDSIEPYLAYKDKGVIMLCRTSNPGGSDLQSLDITTGEASKTKVYEHVASLANSAWNRSGQLGLVVGATFPAELARVRELAPELPLLIPGIGAQGGDVAQTVKAGKRKDGYGMMINSSRAILYANSGTSFGDAAAQAAQSTRDQIRAAA